MIYSHPDWYLCIDIKTESIETYDIYLKPHSQRDYYVA